MSPAEVAREARALVDRPTADTADWWSRAAALLARQALESSVRIAISAKGADPEPLTFEVQSIVLAEVVDPDLARRAAATWAALSAACHHHGLEFPAAAEEIEGWLAVVDEVVAATNR